MATKAQEVERANLSAELRRLQESFFNDWVSGSLPDIWDEIPQLHPTQPPRIKVTLTLDEDMVKWFRKLGRGYQARINSILRVYWHALLSGQVKAHWDAEAVAPREYSMLEGMLSDKIAQLRQGQAAGVSEDELGAVESELLGSLEAVQQMHKQKR